MTALTFTIEGDAGELTALRTRLHGALVDELDDAADDGLWTGDVDVDWDLED